MWLDFVILVGLAVDVALFVFGAWLVWDHLNAGDELQAQEEASPRDFAQGRQATLAARRPSST